MGMSNCAFAFNESEVVGGLEVLGFDSLAPVKDGVDYELPGVLMLKVDVHMNEGGPLAGDEDLWGGLEDGCRGRRGRKLGAQNAGVEGRV
jgi:hypothetical protein